MVADVRPFKLTKLSAIMIQRKLIKSSPSCVKSCHSQRRSELITQSCNITYGTPSSGLYGEKLSSEASV